ncbi:hypothetical protein [Arthrobacter sp. JCM 19049]|uniref:diacylglycerol/lipid kinase family protein n=1 Tax=Arthrobacter sp. JCM 19049 TaxID=1460643 RepID=UPI002436D209|nr:hypothetical protein [Arthrobacter sp. JCM 19049]
MTLVHSCLPALIDLGIPMGILPAGSGNDAWRMGRASSVRSTREAILGFLAGHGRIRTSDVLEVSFANEPQRTRFVLGAVSCGFEAQVNEAANALPRWLGATRYGLGLLLCLPRIKPRQLSISATGSPSTAECTWPAWPTSAPWAAASVCFPQPGTMTGAWTHDSHRRPAVPGAAPDRADPHWA